MKNLTALTFSLALLMTPVAADVFDDCAQAVANGDLKAAKKAADTLLVGAGTQVPPEHIEIAGQCIELGRDRPYAYSELRQRYRPLAKAQLDNQIFDLDQQIERAAERRARERKEERDQRAAKQAVVLQRLAIACKNLYVSDPDGTITNKLCLDVFLETGLPD